MKGKSKEFFGKVLLINLIKRKKKKTIAFQFLSFSFFFSFAKLLYSILFFPLFQNRTRITVFPSLFFLLSLKPKSLTSLSSRSPNVYRNMTKRESNWVKGTQIKMKCIFMKKGEREQTVTAIHPIPMSTRFNAIAIWCSIESSFNPAVTRNVLGDHKT